MSIKKDIFVYAESKWKHTKGKLYWLVFKNNLNAVFYPLTFKLFGCPYHFIACMLISSHIKFNLLN